MTAIRIPQFSARSMAVLLAASTAGLFACPAAATTSQVFACIDGGDGAPVQTFFVPEGILELQVIVVGAHGGGAFNQVGGFGGSVQAGFAVGADGMVAPGDQLDVWVGCSGSDPQGYGAGGAGGAVPVVGPWGGGSGGGGSAVLHHQSGLELVVAGGGGGAGGAARVWQGGKGGDGGGSPQAGEPGFGTRAGGAGCVACQGTGEIDGLAGGGGDIYQAGGGGGGGGHVGGGGGGGGSIGGGGGGGAGSSFVAAGATDVAQATSQLAGDGLVVISWGEAGLRDPDRDGIPNPHDRCRSSYLGETVALGRRDSLAHNDLDVDGCTITDRIVRIAQRTDTRTQFLHQARKLVTELRDAGTITAKERHALMRFVHQINVARLRS